MTDLIVNDAAGGPGVLGHSGQLTRRGFAALGAAGAVAACIGTAKAGAFELDETREAIATPHGSASSWFVRPASGRHPGVVMWADPANLGGTDLAAARQLAQQGFAVLVVERGYRQLAAQTGGTASHQVINRDARALVAWLNTQSAVQPAVARATSVSGLGHGYSLRTVTAAAPRLSLASREQRIAAAQSGLLFAVPDATVARDPARMDRLQEIARLAHRAAA